MKVIGFVGSARRNGKTAETVQALAKQLASGGDTEIYYLKDQDIHPCIGCEYCRTREGCSQKDDMQLFLSKLYDADAVIIGSPVYFGGMSALTKAFTERLYPAYRGKGVSRLQGKKLYLVYSQHSDEAVYSDVRTCEAAYLYKFLKFDIQKVFVNGMDVTQL